MKRSTSGTSGPIRRTVLVAVGLLLALGAACSGASDPATNPGTASGSPDPTSASDASAADAAADGAAGDDAAGDASSMDDSGDTSGDLDVDNAAAESPTTFAAPEEGSAPSAADAGITAVVDGGQGERFEDEAGNQLVVRRVEQWPAAFGDLPNDTRASFPFIDDFAAASSPDVALWSIDVALCAAGVGSVPAGQGGFGDFYLTDSADAPLATSVSVTAAFEPGQPARSPGLVTPAAGTCERGWLAAPWSGDEPPAFVRYVLTLPADGNGTAADDYFVYHWDLSAVATEANAGDEDGAADEDGTGDEDGAAGADGDAAELTGADGVAGIEPLREPFAAGQTVTFGAGDLAESTVTVTSWAERVDVASEFAGTRSVTVALVVCPVGDELPEFGLGVDGWTVISPLPGQALEIDPDTGCFDGPLDFAVPFGSEPTSVFASDDTDPVAGYAEWSLVGAAVADSR